MRILLVEDDQMIGEVVLDALRAESWAVDWVKDGAMAQTALATAGYDLVLLDLGLPKVDGLQVLREMRARQVRIPVLVATARDAIAERVAGLDAGADDYIIKPYDLDELLARIRALLRQLSAGAPDGELQYGQLGLKCQHKEAYAQGKPLKLTLKEYELLEYFMLGREQILTKEQLLDRVWGIDSDAGLGVVDVYVHYLRRKLAPFGLDSCIQTVRGVGYLLKEKK